ncbi:MAG: histidinol-phosphatase [Eubacteriales bacterium]|nr:histidinol-phosphatase [Eubacteriales bacterium]
MVPFYTYQPRRNDPIRANYHTHTTRCKHAQGSDRDYVLAAIQGGFSRLGFSDHTPWPYPDGFVSPTRMDMDELAGYVQSVNALKAAHAGEIEIRLGLEAEHYPEYTGWLLEMKQAHGVDYLLLGSHFDTRYEEVYYGKISSPEHVVGYAKLTLEGIASGLYDCLAHPDLFLQAYPRFDDVCLKASRDICRAARDMDLPLEYNLSGFYNVRRRRGGLGYPCLEFWQVAAEEGLSAIIGIDAHSPERMLDAPLYDLARQHLRALGIREVTSLGNKAHKKKAV